MITSLDSVNFTELLASSFVSSIFGGSSDSLSGLKTTFEEKITCLSFAFSFVSPASLPSKYRLPNFVLHDLHLISISLKKSSSSTVIIASSDEAFLKVAHFPLFALNLSSDLIN